MLDTYFSESYSHARQRFIHAARAVSAECHAYRIDSPLHKDFAIDVAIVGHSNLPTMVVSSGVHGVEGFLGSAIQLALLDRLRTSERMHGVRYVLIHSVNPFGFAHLRRCNEANVDLNRNFLTNDESYQAAPNGYAALDRLLNPVDASGFFELPFRVQAVRMILRHGLSALKNAIAGGQYEFPQGLFFGGSKPAESTRMIQRHMDAWIGASACAAHLDIHSGLGRFATWKLLLPTTSKSTRDFFDRAVGSENVEHSDKPDQTAYQVKGSLGNWLFQHFSQREYHFALAEFGTYNPIRVLAALREENRQHHHGEEGSPKYRNAKAKLKECFCPCSPEWRHAVVESAMNIVDQTAHALIESVAVQCSASHGGT